MMNQDLLQAMTAMIAIAFQQAGVGFAGGLAVGEVEDVPRGRGGGRMWKVEVSCCDHRQRLQPVGGQPPAIGEGSQETPIDPNASLTDELATHICALSLLARPKAWRSMLSSTFQARMGQMYVESVADVSPGILVARYCLWPGSVSIHLRSGSSLMCRTRWVRELSVPHSQSGDQA